MGFAFKHTPTHPLTTREDDGALWENFCVSERMKALHNQRQLPNRYFWRTCDRKEIDYLEEAGGRLSALEFKWNPNAKVRKPAEFFETYPISCFDPLTRALRALPHCVTVGQ